MLKSGKEVQADLIIWTVGAKPNTEFLKSTELASTLDEAGRVKVPAADALACFFFVLLLAYHTVPHLACHTVPHMPGCHMCCAATVSCGAVQVEPTLQVVGFPNIFALGDINDVKEEKLVRGATHGSSLLPYRF